MSGLNTFHNLTPEIFLEAVEDVTNTKLTGITYEHASYINRVYEIRDVDGGSLIVKFYRPDRWTKESILEEHQYVGECATAEIPVIAPMALNNGSTLAEKNGMFYTVFPKRFGRAFEVNSEEDWMRIGRIMGRIHSTGAENNAPNRIKLHPQTSTKNDIQQLLDGDFIDKNNRTKFCEISTKILNLITPLFDNTEYIRIHGDSHPGNLLDRPGEGLMVIDFDDMMMGPPVQDLWMLLPDHINEAQDEFYSILAGYEEFRDFDYSSMQLIEPLRAMRILYFLSWCSKQVNDKKFKHNFPDWGSENFWQQEIYDLNEQYESIIKSLDENSGNFNI